MTTEEDRPLPSDIACPFCGGENGEHDANCGLSGVCVYEAARATYGNPHVDIIVKNAIAATIERCADVARKYADKSATYPGRVIALKIADEISALGEKP